MLCFCCKFITKKMFLQSAFDLLRPVIQPTTYCAKTSSSFTFFQRLLFFFRFYPQKPSFMVEWTYNYYGISQSMIFINIVFLHLSGSTLGVLPERSRPVYLPDSGRHRRQAGETNQVQHTARGAL